MATNPDDIDDIDNPELTEADFAKGRPFREVHPEAFASWKRSRGRPTINGRPKTYIGFRFAPELVDAVKASGKGYNGRVEKILSEALAKGLL